MNTRGVLFLCVGLLLGALIGYIVSNAVNQRVIRTLRARVRELRSALQSGAAVSELERGRMETMKKIVLACLINGFAWIWCSYILAALDKVQIAESLSTAAVTQIIGAVVAYAVKSLVENLSKYNPWLNGTRGATPEEPEPGGDGEAEG